MPASSRRKGVTGEAEVRRILERKGLVVRGLEASGDWLCAISDDRVLHIEVKRAERLKLPEWLRQAEAEAPSFAMPVVTFRQNRGEWYAALPLAALVELVS